LNKHLATGGAIEPTGQSQPLNHVPNRNKLGGSMGKYFLGWLLGVPVFVLVLIYFFFH
jgi:hypothetical protein